MPTIVDVRGLSKTYASGHQALKPIDLQIEEGEILALLGPNGAGKTTLISVICGIVTPSMGSVSVGGHDILTGFRGSRALIGLVPQELHVDAFETVKDTVKFSRGLFGLRNDPAVIERVLRALSLWEKRDARIMELSGGMKRRVLIAKALSHEPRVLFLDEPTAGVDVELRKDMWQVVGDLRATGVTIILTTHYIEEAEAIADRIGVISKGEILLVEEKAKLMARLGRKEMRIELQTPAEAIPDTLAKYELTRAEDGSALTYAYHITGSGSGTGRRSGTGTGDGGDDGDGITRLLGDLSAAGLVVRDLQTRQSSLEDIFVDLVKEGS